MRGLHLLRQLSANVAIVPSTTLVFLTPCRWRTPICTEKTDYVRHLPYPTESHYSPFKNSIEVALSNWYPMATFVLACSLL